MESEIEKTVRKISKDKNILQIDMEQRQLLEIDEKGLKKYLDLVIREVKKWIKKITKRFRLTGDTDLH